MTARCARGDESAARAADAEERGEVKVQRAGDGVQHAQRMAAAILGGVELPEVMMQQHRGSGGSAVKARAAVAEIFLAELRLGERFIQGAQGIEALRRQGASRLGKNRPLAGPRAGSGLWRRDI